MVDPLIGEQPYFIKGVRDEFLLRPEDIPIIILCLLVRSLLHHCWDTIHEVGLELDFGSKVRRELRVEGEIFLLYVFSKVLRHRL